ncbi:MAG TPA: hypothetical protein PLO07_07640 [Rubrivivax sp.]|nr:hypothetical protein [Rubrivivax sp.]
MVWLKCSGIAVALLALAGVVLVALGDARWDAATEVLRARLEATHSAPRPTHYASSELQGLPAPVQRYLRLALTEGQPIVAAAELVHSGSFNLSEDGERWWPFSSRQRVLTQRPGFLWDGRVALLPGLTIRVHDAYIAGEGRLHPALWGLLTLLELRDSDELARDELMRWLAEAAWYPTALLPSQGVRWEPLDEHSARATLRDGAIELTLNFAFGADGMIASVHSPARGRTLSGKRVPTPWEGRWWGVQQRGGMRIPLSGEVAWLTPEGRKPYWRGTITSIAYDFAR